MLNKKLTKCPWSNLSPQLNVVTKLINLHHIYYSDWHLCVDKCVQCWPSVVTKVTIKALFLGYAQYKIIQSVLFRGGSVLVTCIEMKPLIVSYQSLRPTPRCRFSAAQKMQDNHKTAKQYHYNDVIMGAAASRITSLTIVYSSVYSGADQRKHQRSASLASVRRIHRWPVNSPYKGPLTRKMFPFDDVIMSPVYQLVSVEIFSRHIYRVVSLLFLCPNNPKIHRW